LPPPLHLPSLMEAAVACRPRCRGGIAWGGKRERFWQGHRCIAMARRLSVLLATLFLLPQSGSCDRVSHSPFAGEIMRHRIASLLPSLSSTGVDETRNHRVDGNDTEPEPGQVDDRVRARSSAGAANPIGMARSTGKSWPGGEGGRGRGRGEGGEGGEGGGGRERGLEAGEKPPKPRGTRQKRCKHLNGCVLQASFGDVGGKALFCSKHKLPQHRNVRARSVSLPSVSDNSLINDPGSHQHCFHQTWTLQRSPLSLFPSHG